MRTRTLDLRPTRLHGQPRSPAAGPAGPLPRRSWSIGRIIAPWLRIMLVALGVAAVVGPLPATAEDVVAGPHRQAPGQPTATATDCSQVSGAEPYNWMQVIAPCIVNRRLTDILIPGSHDSGTYSFDPSSIAKTQSIDLYGQLDSGVRQLDVRVSWDIIAGWITAHGISHSGVTLAALFNQVERWADAGNATVNHGHEIILVNMSIDQKGTNNFPTNECSGLGSLVNVLTPNMLEKALGKADPGAITFGDIWSLPKKPGLENVPWLIMDNTQCANAASGESGQWNTIDPLLGGYYTDYCAIGTSAFSISENLLVTAAAARAMGQQGSDHPINPGPSKVDGFYALSIQGTPFAIPICDATPLVLYPPQLNLWNQPGSATSIASRWLNPVYSVRENLNIVNGDYIDGGWLSPLIINLNVQPAAPKAPTINGIANGRGQVSVAFSAHRDSGTAPITQYTVTATRDGAPSRTATETSSPITVNGLDNLAGYFFTVTATSAAGRSRPSAPVAMTVGAAAPPTIDDGPAYKGVLGVPYHSSFAFRAMLGSMVTLEWGRIPPGLILKSDGTLTGTPTTAGAYQFGVRATGRFGTDHALATVVIHAPGTPHLETSWQSMDARVCVWRANEEANCASRLLRGTIPQPGRATRVSLVSGSATYAIGHITGDGKLELRHQCETPSEDHGGLKPQTATQGTQSEPRCEVPFGRYTLALHGDQGSIFVPVTLQ